MQTKVEGLVLNKLFYKERHLICPLLLRSGKKISVLFLGGRGGGKKQKSSTLELGHLLKIELIHSRATKELYCAREWIPLWMHQKIRFDYKAYHLMCFFLEMAEKISVGEYLHGHLGGHSTKGVGVFKVLANGIYYLEKAVEGKKFSPEEHGAFFLGKLLLDQGVFPERRECTFCGENIIEGQNIFLIPNRGGFSCHKCCRPDSEQGQKENHLWQFLGDMLHLPYKEFIQKKYERTTFLPSLLHYVCYQLHLEQEKLKTASIVL